jgi:hypothetical protein
MFVEQLPEQVPGNDDAAKRAFRRGAAAVATLQAGAELSPALSVAAAEQKLERLRMPPKDGR